MKIVPFLKVRDIQEAIDFYTEILDFELKYPDFPFDDWGVDLINGEAELQLSVLEGVPGLAINVFVNNVDALFEKYTQRGLNQAHRIESPVHLGPTDQTWGRREFYVTDPSGNTLRFAAPIQLIPQ